VVGSDGFWSVNRQLSRSPASLCFDYRSNIVFTLDVDASSTVAAVRKLAIDKDPSLATATLVLDTTNLDDSKTLQDYNITADSTLQVSTGAPRKKSRKRCSAANCLSAPMRGVGDCGFCEGHFCGKHRLLEQHNCIGLQNCKQQLHERNAIKLHQQQTVANKV